MFTHSTSLQSCESSQTRRFPLITHNCSTKLKRRLKAAGVHCLLTKPLDIPAVLALVDRYTGQGAPRGASAEPKDDPMPDHDELQHTFKNHLSVIVGFCDMLLLDLPPQDQTRESVEEIRKAAHAALGLVPRLQRD